MLNPLSCILWLIVGGVAGTIAGRLLRGRGYGLVGDVVLGLIGSVVGGMLFSLVGINLGGLCGELVAATVGAVVLVWVLRIFVRQDFGE
ncbi:MAG: GlsB/YeaQ/YmgE family stress response membrane protein [Anaerolineae bacterium]|nr:GlsB/YeaQ/YmgE family stress response membrane protein [Anaerolineae bacterium]